MPTREIVLAGTSDGDLTKLDEYRAVGGYAQLARARELEPQAIVAELDASNLRGRGGAFFATGKKASFVPRDSPKPKYLTVNADESDPGTFKDREIMLRVPHRVVEGSLITAHAIESQHVFIYIRGEYLTEFEVLRAALDEAKEAELLGGVTIVLHRGAGAYICGEETGLLESLEGKRGQPRAKPPYPAVTGLYGAPTLINNVETVATVPKILELGGAEYAKIGTPDSTGTRVFSLSGNVVRGGNYELPNGTTLRELIYDVGGGVPDGRELKAIIPGGSSVGSGGVVVIDDRACIVELGLRVAQFYMHESCGKCTPCREGTRWMVQLLHKIEDGEADESELDLLLSVCDRILGHCLCPLGDAAAMPIASYVDKFRDEFRQHVLEGRCPYGGESSLEDLFAPVDQHRGHPTVELAT